MVGIRISGGVEILLHVLFRKSVINGICRES